MVLCAHAQNTHQRAEYMRNPEEILNKFREKFTVTNDDDSRELSMQLRKEITDDIRQALADTVRWAAEEAREYVQDVDEYHSNLLALADQIEKIV